MVASPDESREVLKVTKERATGKDVILAVAENMHSSLEPLITKTLAPSRYQVYLHPDDYDHLRTLLPELEAEARQILDREIEKLNRSALPPLQRFLPRVRKRRPGEAAPLPPQPKYLSAEGKWTVRFQEDPDGTLRPGDIQVISEFAQAPSAGYGAGSATRRISTTRRLGQPLAVERQGVSPAAGTVPAEAPAAFAKIAFKDDKGAQTFWVTKDEVVIGREAADVWVDLRLDTSLDVSREHARLRRTPEGTFRIKDLSKLGTSVNGAPLPSSLEPGGEAGKVRDLDRWTDLPDRARIGLAGVVFLDFERLSPR